MDPMDTSPDISQHDRKTFIMPNRVVNSVVCPPSYPLNAIDLFDSKTNMPRLDVLKTHLLKEGRIDDECAEILITRAKQLFNTEPNMLDLAYPLTVCGDIHGQYFDLVRLFEVGGNPNNTRYLFLGDYVDRGCFSTECVFYLYAHKITYPNSFHMLRGNHECRQLTSFFNFKDECAYKYSLKLYDMIMDSFDSLPLAAVINKSFFCVHGGLSPDINSLDQIRKLDRFKEIPREGAMCDLLWSDPYEEENNNDNMNNNQRTNSTATRSTNSRSSISSSSSVSSGSSFRDGDNTKWFGYNDTRQCSYMYGIEAVKQFLKDNQLTSLIRAHEAQIDGFRMQMVNQSNGIPRVITIFSAPNYCDVYKNKAACLKFDNAVLNIKQFVNSPHPYYLPNFMDVFHWSLPFVAEKVTDMLANVLEAGSSIDESIERSTIKLKGSMFKKKVQAVSRMLRVYKILRQENEAIINLKQLTPHHKVPMGLLSQGPEEIHKVIQSFNTAKSYDKQWESRPTLEKRGLSPYNSFTDKDELAKEREMKNRSFRKNKVSSSKRRTEKQEE